MGKSKSDHDTKLHSVLTILVQNGLTAEWEKCKFGVRSVTCLGHEISEKGIEPKRANVSAIKDAPPPTKKEDICSFLGMAEFYSKFGPHFASKTHHLRQLLKERNTFKWSSEEQMKFDELKQDICKAIPLKGFDHAACPY
ncbi:uncharacterized protein LOC144820321 [Lissotriton helveticus]